MSTTIVDRRGNSKGKSSGNRQRLLKRIQQQIKESIPTIIDTDDIKGITSKQGNIKIPVKGVSEPTFVYDRENGVRRGVHPGNKEYSEGDQIPKPDPDDYGRGSRGSNDPTITQDDFVVSISKEEFLDYFFQDLELPDLVKKYLQSETEFQTKRAGFIQYGTPSRLNIVRSYRNSLARRIATLGFYKSKLKKLQEELDTNPVEPRYSELLLEIDKIKKQMSIIPYIDEVDLRYNNFEKKAVPALTAVMICIMDVSGSMDEDRKDIAKRFFLLLYMFLTRQYQKVELVFIRHHTEAKEVTEEEFFNSQESGGTEITPAFELVKKIIEERYGDGKHNIYAVEASDGDTWDTSDALKSTKLIQESILPRLQYMAYIEIQRKGESELLHCYNTIIKDPKFVAEKIDDVSEIWPVFRRLFEKKTNV